MKRFNVVVAPRNGGKTKYLSSLQNCKGILTKSIDREKNELFFFDIESRNTHPFLKRVDKSYKVEKGAFKWAERLLLNINSGNIIIDECGRIELLSKGGFYNTINELINNDNITLYIAVRDTNLDLFLETYKQNWNIIRL